jgi:hypothetical protein
MTFELDIQTLDIDFAQEKFEEIRIPIQAAMASRFATIVGHNFGFEGEDRPKPWPALSFDYAQHYHKGVDVPTEILSGDMMNSVRIDETNPDAASVFVDPAIEYAASQQATRPFFPMTDDGELTPYAIDEVTRAAQNEAERLLR